MLITPATSVTLKCLGTVDGPRFLDGRTGNDSVGLAPSTDAPFTGTRWTVVDDKSGHLILKCLGVEGGGAFLNGTVPKFLDGRTVDGTVGLAPSTTGVFTGTHWDALDDGPNRVILKCLGNVDGPRFLDGRTVGGTVGLAPATTGVFTGTHWEVVNAQRIDSLAGTSGNLVTPDSVPLNGFVGFTLRPDGSFTTHFHAHCSGTDSIDYVTNALFITPSGKAFSFQMKGNVNAVDPDDNQDRPGNNAIIRDNWGDVVGGTAIYNISGHGFLEDALKQAWNDLIAQAEKALGEAIKGAIVSLL